jgi:hypothetical protein
MRTGCNRLLRHVDDLGLREFFESFLTHLRAEAGLLGAAEWDVRGIQAVTNDGRTGKLRPAIDRHYQSDI